MKTNKSVKNTIFKLQKSFFLTIYREHRWLKLMAENPLLPIHFKATKKFESVHGKIAKKSIRVSQNGTPDNESPNSVIQ